MVIYSAWWRADQSGPHEGIRIPSFTKTKRPGVFVFFRARIDRRRWGGPSLCNLFFLRRGGRGFSQAVPKYSFHPIVRNRDRGRMSWITHRKWPRRRNEIHLKLFRCINPRRGKLEVLVSSIPGKLIVCRIIGWCLCLQEFQSWNSRHR